MSEIETFLKNYSFCYKILPVSAMTGLNVDTLLKTLTEYAQEASQDNEKETAYVLHVNMAKMFHGERYYYGMPLTSKEVQSGDVLTLYPLNKPVTITHTSHGRVGIQEQIDISSGDCLSNVPVFVSNTISHKTIWFSEHSTSLLLKHGTRIARVIHYDENTLELDKEIIFNNIEDVKQNGFGIFIDPVSKRTVGCAVFENNAQNQTRNSSLHSADKLRLKKEDLLQIFALSDTEEQIKRLLEQITAQGFEVEIL